MITTTITVLLTNKVAKVRPMKDVKSPRSHHRTSSSGRTIAKMKGKTNASQTGTQASRTAKMTGSRSDRTTGRINVSLIGTLESKTVRMTGSKSDKTTGRVTVRMSEDRMIVVKMTGERTIAVKTIGERMTVARTSASLTLKRPNTPCLLLKSKPVVASRSLLKRPRLIRRAQANPRVATRSLLTINRRTTKISALLTLLTKLKHVKISRLGSWRLAGCPRATILEPDLIITATDANTLMADG